MRATHLALAAALACDPAPDPAPDPIAAFVEDLRAHLDGHYEKFGDDIAMSGGNSLAAAKAAVQAAKVAEIEVPEDDPYGHDLAVFRVFTHPDVVFPGSDNVWYGAYDREDGALVEIYEFN